ncbi:hypothetical protein F2P81_004433 [Scophthalmus maximus]|uniref:Uncharacterized protein n=1 Tax=Scophthalmus maximus TaxID=52904 RepID=A0A6A4T677_SCOMX|nr:hypothetical protein F2P81_004433 [Scophthalmus maximus]
MDVLEASASKPSVSSLVLMMVCSREEAGLSAGQRYDMQPPPPGSTSLRRSCDRELTLFRAAWTRMERTDRSVHFSSPPRGGNGRGACCPLRRQAQGGGREAPRGVRGNARLSPRLRLSGTDALSGREAGHLFESPSVTLPLDGCG